MLWLQTPPWGRWAAALALLAAAAWVELRPDTLVDHPFAAAPIAAGDEVNEANTEMRRVPAGLLDAVSLGATAIRSVEEGSPVLDEDVGSPGSRFPAGWWVVSAEIPPWALVGDRVRLVMLDSGAVAEGVVASRPSDDPLAPGEGGVAVSPESADEAAAAAAEGRLAVLVSTG